MSSYATSLTFPVVGLVARQKLGCYSFVTFSARVLFSSWMSKQPVRETIWSVPEEALGWFYFGFGAQIFVGAVYLWYVLGSQSIGLPIGIIPIWQYLGPLVLVSASLTIIGIQSFYYCRYRVRKFRATAWITIKQNIRKRKERIMSMVFADYLERKLKEELEKIANTPEKADPPRGPYLPPTPPPAQFRDREPPKPTPPPSLPPTSGTTPLGSSEPVPEEHSSERG